MEGSESVFGPSMTVPDESLTIREILEKYVRGLGSSVTGKDPVFDPSADFDSDDLEALSRENDPFERSESVERYKQASARMKAALGESASKVKAKKAAKKDESSEDAPAAPDVAPNPDDAK